LTTKIGIYWTEQHIAFQVSVLRGGNLWYNSNSELADVAQEVGAVCVLDGKEEGMIRGELKYFLSY